MTADRPTFWRTLKASFGDALSIARQAPGLTAATAAAVFVEAAAYDAAVSASERGWRWTLLWAVDGVVNTVIGAPLCVAVLRSVLIGERPGFAALRDKRDILIDFAAVMSAIALASVVSLTLVEAVFRPEDALARVAVSLAAMAVLLAVTVRLGFLQPAIATRAPGASLRASWRMTRGVFWPLLGVIVALAAPVLLVRLVIGVAELEGLAAPVPTPLLLMALDMLFMLPGSVFVARYYAWRLAQG